jgi:hypothetical protein
MAIAEVERQQRYRERLDAVDKTIVRIVVAKDVARRLRSLAHGDVSRQGAVLTKALDALERFEAASVRENS